MEKNHDGSITFTPTELDKLRELVCGYAQMAFINGMNVHGPTDQWSKSMAAEMKAQREVLHFLRTGKMEADQAIEMLRKKLAQYDSAEAIVESKVSG